MEATEIQLIISIITIFGAGFASYVGVRVAIAEQKRDLEHHGKQLEDHNERITYLERKSITNNNK